MFVRLLAVVLSTALVPAAALADATMFRGGPVHTGVYPGTAIASAPHLKWQFKTGGRVIASPAVAGNTVYAGSADGSLYALDLGTGTQKWKFSTKARIASSPAVANGLVFFESYDGNFYALDSNTGTVKWQFAVPGERRFAAPRLHGYNPHEERMPDPFDFYLSSPVIAKDVVYFGSGNGNVYALDAAGGALKWAFKTGDVVHSSPALADGTLYVGSWDSYLYAIDAATGTEKWRFETGHDEKVHNQVGIQSSPAVANGMVYFGCRDSNLYAVDAKSGKEVWRYNNKGSWVIASPAVAAGRVYAATSDTGQFFALDAKTGAKLYAVDFNHWPMFSSPAIVGSTAYIGSHTGKLFAIDLKTQKLAWDFQTDGSKANLASITSAKDGTPDYANVFSEPFYDDLVAGTDRLMRAGVILSSPVVAGRVVVFGSNDGNVYALE
jgi:outer membrane protein assembly factor BamB